MYPSDYSYTYALGVDNTCYTSGDSCSSSSGKTNGWIYNTNSNSVQWLLSPRLQMPIARFFLAIPDISAVANLSRVVLAYVQLYI